MSFLAIDNLLYHLIEIRKEHLMMTLAKFHDTNFGGRMSLKSKLLMPQGLLVE